MRDISSEDFARRLAGSLRARAPLDGQLELTRRCSLSCVHCYCGPAVSPAGELPGAWWIALLGEIRSLGGLHVTLTGGEPLLHPDFRAVYGRARSMGFLVTVFSNAVLWDDTFFELMSAEPPAGIEVTLNGVTPEVWTAVTGGRPVDFRRVLANLRRAAELGLPLVLKANGLRENRDEIASIKRFAADLLGPGRFKFDPLIVPRLDGDRRPLDHRLSPREIVDMEESDPDMRREKEKPRVDPGLPAESLYRCTSWMTGYFIGPDGRMRFCSFTDCFSADLKADSFARVFTDVFPLVARQRSTGPSPCARCPDRTVCYCCPARAALETGRAEGPVPYYCALCAERALAAGGRPAPDLALMETTGSSMHPFLRAGERIIVRRRAARDFRRGDLAVYRSAAAGRIVCHRVVGFERRAGGTVLRVRADNAPSFVENVADGDLLGAVVGVCGARGRMRFAGRPSRAAGRLIGAAAPLLAPVRRLVRKAVRLLWR